MKLKAIIVIIFFSANFQSHSQYSFTKKRELFLYNTLSSGIIGGVGAILHKKEETAGKAFVKGFYKGVLSGGVIYLGKDLISEFSRTNNFSYVWGSKLITYTGVSMLENTTRNQPLFENIHFNTGFLRFDLVSKNKLKFKGRIMPMSLVNTLWLLTKYKLDLKYTFNTGSIVFSGILKPRKIDNKITAILGTVFYGGDVITINKNYSLYHASKESIFSHELIHVYQIEYFSSLNFVYKKLEKKIFNRKTEEWINDHFYIDYNLLTFYLLYQSTYRLKVNYKKNIFESEAYFFMYK